MNDDSERKLKNDMVNIYKRSYRECGYRPTRFLEMVDRKGALIAAKELIMKAGTEGFTKLWKLGRLDLSLEALICSGKYNELFTNEEIEICKEKLREYNYNI